MDANSPAVDGRTGPQGLPEEPPRPLVLAVLGGIASGKALVARLLAGPDGVVLSADDAAHEALRSNEVVKNLRETFGPDVIGADGAPDRAALGAIVFRDPEKRKLLEGWIHPVVRATLHRSLEEAAHRGVPRVVLDVPLLLENAAEHGLLALCDALAFSSRGWEPGEVARREAAQMPLTQKRERADVVIDNRTDLASLERSVRAALERLVP